MKRVTIICAVLLLGGFVPSTAKAVTWSFEMETYDESTVVWSSDTAVETGYPGYDYDWELTEADVWVVEQGAAGVPFWFPILDGIAPADKIGSGSSSGLPIDIYGMQGLSIPDISAVLYLGVHVSGMGIAQLSDINFGTISGTGGTVYDVIGTRIGGNLTVIPEPATVFLLGLGGLVFLRRRRT